MNNNHQSKNSATNLTEWIKYNNRLKDLLNKNDKFEIEIHINSSKTCSNDI